ERSAPPHGATIAEIATKAVAWRLAFLPRSELAQRGTTDGDLVARRRDPRRPVLRLWTVGARAAVLSARRATDPEDLPSRQVDELSCGQRQRVWVAIVPAQETSLLLLDEPTTFLDLAFQIELLDLFSQLNHEYGHTLVAVLHDLNQACRYADEIIAM